MNASQIHLALTHVPVILSFVGLIVLIVALIKKNETVTKTSFYILLAAGLFTLPVYFTGEGAEEIVENLPGVSESIISKHEDVAAFTLIIIAITACLALAGLLFYNKKSIGKLARIGVFVLSIVAAGAMAQTAHLGGQIRHSEIRPGAVASNAQELNGQQDNQETINSSKEKDED
jgi:uncharacterized membrane protein